MRELDPFEVIAFHAEYPVAVLTDAEHTQVELVPLADEVNEATRERLESRGLHFVAVCGTLNGKSEIEMVYPLPEQLAFAVGVAVRDYLAGIQSKDPEYDWVARRYHH